MGIGIDQAIAVGDGANDLPMMMAARLSTGRWKSCAPDLNRRDGHAARRVATQGRAWSGRL
jgi:phosphoserine phosphatase